MLWENLRFGRMFCNRSGAWAPSSFLIPLENVIKDSNHGWCHLHVLTEVKTYACAKCLRPLLQNKFETRIIIILHRNAWTDYNLYGGLRSINGQNWLTPYHKIELILFNPPQFEHIPLVSVALEWSFWRPHLAEIYEFLSGTTKRMLWSHKHKLKGLRSPNFCSTRC